MIYKDFRNTAKPLNPEDMVILLDREVYTMSCKVNVIRKDGKKLSYENAIVKKEKGAINIYQPHAAATCMKPLAKFDPCKLKSVYIDWRVDLTAPQVF